MSASPNDIRIPADLLPRDGRFGCGPSKVRPEAVQALADVAGSWMGTSHRQAPVKDVVGSVRASKLEAAARTKLPYDRIVDSADLASALADEKFDVIIDAVGGAVRSQSFALMRPGSRLIVAGNASGGWSHEVKTNDLWLGCVSVTGFNTGAYLPTHPHTIRPALEAALRVAADGLGEMEIDVLPFSKAVAAHERMESRALNGRIVLTPDG